MKGLKIVSGIIALLLVMPIWYYLLYKILIAVNATELMMFLYWVYLPAGLIAQIISKITSNED